MKARAKEMLDVLDRCCGAFSFPMLDNGYVYLAATRLALFRSDLDWAMVIEVFGFSPRSGLPDTHIHTFASRLHDRTPPEKFASRQAYENYLANNPNNESRFVSPIEEGPWQDQETFEELAEDAAELVLRGEPIVLPKRDEYALHEIELSDPSCVRTFELCRYLAAVARERVLATPAEQCANVLPNMSRLLQLDEWHHPDVVDDSKRPSGSETFQQLARVLESGDVSLYRPTQPPNTHWRNWPDGGTL